MFNYLSQFLPCQCERCSKLVLRRDRIAHKHPKSGKVFKICASCNKEYTFFDMVYGYSFFAERNN